MFKVVLQPQDESKVTPTMLHVVAESRDESRVTPTMFQVVVEPQNVSRVPASTPSMYYPSYFTKFTICSNQALGYVTVVSFIDDYFNS